MERRDEFDRLGILQFYQFIAIGIEGLAVEWICREFQCKPPGKYGLAVEWICAEGTRFARWGFSSLGIFQFMALGIWLFRV